MYLDEIRNLRKHVVEKSRFYLVYSIVIALIVAISYYLISTIPNLSIDKGFLSAYVYMSILVLSTPPASFEKEFSPHQNFIF